MERQHVYSSVFLRVHSDCVTWHVSPLLLGLGACLLYHYYIIYDSICFTGCQLFYCWNRRARVCRFHSKLAESFRDNICPIHQFFIHLCRLEEHSIGHQTSWLRYGYCVCICRIMLIVFSCGKSSWLQYAYCVCIYDFDMTLWYMTRLRWWVFKLLLWFILW